MDMAYTKAQLAAAAQIAGSKPYKLNADGSLDRVIGVDTLRRKATRRKATRRERPTAAGERSIPRMNKPTTTRTVGVTLSSQAAPDLSSLPVDDPAFAAIGAVLAGRLEPIKWESPFVHQRRQSQHPKYRPRRQRSQLAGGGRVVQVAQELRRNSDGPAARPMNARTLRRLRRAAAHNEKSQKSWNSHLT